MHLSFESAKLNYIKKNRLELLQFQSVFFNFFLFIKHKKEFLRMYN